MVKCRARKGGDEIIHWEAWCSLVMSAYHAPYMARGLVLLDDYECTIV